MSQKFLVNYIAYARRLRSRHEIDQELLQLNYSPAQIEEAWDFIQNPVLPKSRISLEVYRYMWKYWDVYNLAEFEEHLASRLYPRFAVRRDFRTVKLFIFFKSLTNEPAKTHRFWQVFVGYTVANFLILFGLVISSVYWTTIFVVGLVLCLLTIIMGFLLVRNNKPFFYGLLCGSILSIFGGLLLFVMLIIISFVTCDSNLAHYTCP